MKHYYKTLGTSVINSQLSPPSLPKSTEYSVQGLDNGRLFNKSSPPKKIFVGCFQNMELKKFGKIIFTPFASPYPSMAHSTKLEERS